MIGSNNGIDLHLLYNEVDASPRIILKGRAKIARPFVLSRDYSGCAEHQQQVARTIEINEVPILGIDPSCFLAVI